MRKYSQESFVKLIIHETVIFFIFLKQIAYTMERKKAKDRHGHIIPRSFQATALHALVITMGWLFVTLDRVSFK